MAMRGTIDSDVEEESCLIKSIPETEDFLATISDSEYNRNIRPK